MTDDEKILRDWQQRVEGFGGRVGAPLPLSIWKELEASNLGSQTTLPTSEANPTFQPRITLAEMRVSHPITVDVVFQYFNMIAAPMPTGEVDVNTDLGVDQGDGYVEVTWGGSPGSPRQTVRIDGNRGWRFPFTASYLRVDYIPIDEGTVPEWHITGGQLRDLGISASIAPASGAPCRPLTKTVFFRSMDALAVFNAAGVIPDYAVTFTLSMFGGPNVDMTISQGPADIFVGTSRLESNGVAGEWPRWQFLSQVFPIEQNAKFFIWFTGVNNQPIERPAAVCELQL